MDPMPPDDRRPQPSLLQQVRWRHPPRAGWPRWAGAAVLAGLALTAVIAGLLGRQARREAVALGDRVAESASARDADRAGAALFGSATIGENLAVLANHLPPGARLALAAREPAGGLTIAIDSADPDTLRQTLRADTWFAAFHERGQAVGEDGAIRVTFERAP